MRPALLTAAAAAAAIVTAVLPATPADAVIAANQTWVSGTGDDANPCTRTAPCKTFAGAISKTFSGGDINAIDPGGFGSVTVTKAVTIDGTGSFGSILASGGNGIVVNAGPADDVVLRNLDLSGAGCSAATGIRIVGGRSLTLDHVRIGGFQTAIGYAGSGTTAPTFRLVATHVDVTSACTSGIDLAPASGHPVDAVLIDSSIRGSGTAVKAATGADLSVIRSTVTGNQAGVVTSGGTVHAGCGTSITGNVTNGAVTDSVCATGGSPTASTASPPSPTSTTPVGGATRTWVSGVGDDQSPCSRTAPCGTLAGAAAQTSAGGYVDALDAVSAEPLTLDKALTVDGAGRYLGIRATSGAGIVVAAGPQDDVVLHDLVLDGAGCSGTTGIQILGGRSLTLDHVRIHGFKTAIAYQGSASTPFALTASSLDVSGACDVGLDLTAGGTHPVQVDLTDSVVGTSGTAVEAGPGAEVRATRTTLALNAVGLAVNGGAVHAGCGAELVRNGADGAFTDNSCATPTPTTPTTPTTPAPQATPSTSAAAYCLVPRLRNKTSAAAVRALSTAGCAVRTKKRHALRKNRGRVLAQSIPAGVSVKRRTVVVLTVGR